MKNLIRRPGSATAWLAVLSALFCLVGQAHAQWAWRDASGNITYSDAPPPADVKPANILQQPAPLSAADLRRATSGSDGGDLAPQQGRNIGTQPAPIAPATSNHSLAEQEADFRKRSADREKVAKKAEQDEAQSNARAAACAQAKGYLQLIESGTRLMRADAEGNPSFVDEEQRAAEVQKAQDGIAKNCT